jgi:pimeloyl-ACP methyl ester carboxylesterase
VLYLVQTTTRDGVRLDGAYQAAAAPGSAGLPIDAIVFVHGTGGNFYSSTLFDALAERLLSLGVGVLRANTRGHDLMCTASTARGGVRAGAAYEIVDDCRHDLAAWAGWLRQQAGARAVGLLGHSLGAVKCLYAQAREPDPPAACIVAVSPPRLSHSWFAASDAASEFRATYDRARALVEAGEPGALLEVRLPLPFVVTAAGYAEKYGPDERYNYLNFVTKAPCPVLVTLGGQETASNIAFRDTPAALAELFRDWPNGTVELIGGADHFYNGVREALAGVIESWLRARLCPLDQATSGRTDVRAVMSRLASPGGDRP